MGYCIAITVISLNDIVRYSGYFVKENFKLEIYIYMVLPLKLPLLFIIRD